MDMQTATEKCFACDRPLRGGAKRVTCADEQTPHVGPECFRKIKAAGTAGWQPALGGPRLYTLECKPVG